MRKVFIPLNALDPNEVNQQGHGFFVPFLKEIGAEGIEIRRELLTPKDYPLSQLKKLIQEQGLNTVYSAPVELWGEDGELNHGPLQEVTNEVHALAAQTLKLPLGHYKENHSDLGQLKEFIEQLPAGTNLLIENDQTPHGGNVHQLKLFFEAASKTGVNVAMTFDMGNWLYTGEDVHEALSKLKQYVEYVHLKHVERQETGLVTLPMPLNEKNQILEAFPDHLPVALEFPLNRDLTAKRYVDHFSKEDQEAVTWSN